jgi:phosphoribosylaminoimidazole-succinocarboxamide synthase
VSDLKKAALLYEGKAKKVFAVVDEPGLAWLEFKDSLTAFNAQKKGEFSEKGALNSQMAALIFRRLEAQGLKTHWVKNIDAANMIVTRLKMVPLELVVRNRVAGSLAKKFGLQEGEPLRHPLVEFYYKNDELQDPFVSDEQILAFGWVESSGQLEQMKSVGLQVNSVLKDLFARAGLDLVDFKIELGLDHQSELVIADEITPDSCRLWDVSSGERMDKDRFRRDLGRVKESYEEVWARLKKLEEDR